MVTAIFWKRAWQFAGKGTFRRIFVANIDDRSHGARPPASAQGAAVIARWKVRCAHGVVVPSIGTMEPLFRLRRLTVERMALRGR
jgi:hypothetical protein